MTGLGDGGGGASFDSGNEKRWNANMAPQMERRNWTYKKRNVCSGQNPAGASQPVRCHMSSLRVWGGLAPGWMAHQAD